MEQQQRRRGKPYVSPPGIREIARMKRIALAACLVAGIVCVVAVAQFRDPGSREEPLRLAIAERNRAVAVILAAHLAGEFRRTGRYPARLDEAGGIEGTSTPMESVVDTYHVTADGRSCGFSVSGPYSQSSIGEGYAGEGDGNGTVDCHEVAFATTGPPAPHQLTDCRF